jgi:hypothetical protein
MFNLFEVLGISSIIVIVFVLILLPIILTVLVGVAFANKLGFAGIYWWAFVILFYIVITGILGLIGR